MPWGWAVSSSSSASATAEARNAEMASPPLISVKGPRWTGEERRQVCASPEKARAHSADSLSSSAPRAPSGVTTWAWAVAGSTGCHTLSVVSSARRLRRTSRSKASVDSASLVMRGSSALIPPEPTMSSYRSVARASKTARSSGP